MGWKIIEIEESENLSLFLNNLLIKKSNQQITIPINDIDTLLINNYKLKVTIQLLNQLSKQNVLVIICNNDYLPQSIITPIMGNFNTLKVFNKQLAWNNDYKNITWTKIIQQKIINQSLLLKYFLNDEIVHNQTLSLANEIKNLDITNREGHAAKIYWHKLFGLHFKRHNDDIINKMLNYGYTILRGYFIRSIIKKGLDPRISFYHKSFHNHFALASDLMEPFRVLIDKEVYQISQQKNINFYEVKTNLIKCFNSKVLINNLQHYVNNAIDIFIDAIVNQDDLPIVRMIYDE